MTNNLPPSVASLRGAVDLSSLVRPPAPPGAPAPAPGTGGHSLVVDATDASFTGILELSNTVPVVVELHGGVPTVSLTKLITEFGGKLLLARVDASTNPQLQQAFQAQVAPTVAAVVAGRPLALFEGELPEAEARQVFEQLLVLAAQNGVTGTVPVAPAEAAEPVEEPLPPLHQAGYDAIEAGDYPAAMTAYRTAIIQDPRDQLAVAGLAQVSLLHRLAGLSAGAIRDAAAAVPSDVDAQLAVADLDVSGGHLEDAFDRLLTLFPSLDVDGKNAVRTRMLEYFEVAGAEDPRVSAGRRRLTALLY
ncbi:MAG: tetratricopeptide repeat protein [Microbacteriaceae bacterium]|nr:tetratricopeptide repeat protein [Microbacteriaceae bacterium]